MENIFCTLFNSGYMSRGLALYRSMEKSIPEFKLYIFVCDELSFQVLSELELKKAVVINIFDIFSDEEKKILGTRPGASFFWTCTPLVVSYVISTLKEEWCTYVDADCYFYKDPHDAFVRMQEVDKTVGIVEHRFRKDEIEEQMIHENGRFCVEFNTFRNVPSSLKVLADWKANCLKACEAKSEGMFGDQWYLTNWPNEYDCIYVVEDCGIGMAPWNVNNYESLDDLVMYHFHTLNYVTKHLVSMNLWNVKSRKETAPIRKLYREYLAELNSINEIIEETKKTIDFVELTEEENNRADFHSKISEIMTKIKERKEKNIFQLFNNILWVK